MHCEVNVEHGRLQGRECKTHDGFKYYSFEGIPYAKPPVGELRFRAPQGLEKWSGIRDATKPGNKCAQINPFSKGVFEGSEDCLYLNVYTPVLPSEELKKLPVIFFIHGGRLTVGYGDYYSPDFYIRHDTILVTINYRLNILGFLCLDTPEVPGNAGLKDIVMALKWVKKNIVYFNGDDNNITVQGESAGAAVAMSFLTSKMTDGLFDKVICQSGTSLAELYIVEEDVTERARNIAQFLNKDTRDKKELFELFSNASVKDLVHAFTSAEFTRPPSVINAGLLAVIEKQFDNVERFLDKSPITTLRENRHKKVPLILTLNSDEGALFLRKDQQGNIMYEENLQYFIPRYLYIEYDTPKALKFVDSIRKFYFDGRKVDDSLRSQYVNLVSDHYFVRDVIFTIELLSKFQNNIYLCRFGYNGNMNTRVMKSLGFKRATHGDLVQYLFYRENKAKMASDKDRIVVETLVDAWCNFAKNGNPSPKHIDWQPYNTETKLCLNIEEDIKVEPFPNFERVKFWLELIKERSKL
ncbi:unnamed protein product, partial [Brenthis ino]